MAALGSLRGTPLSHTQRLAGATLVMLSKSGALALGGRLGCRGGGSAGASPSSGSTSKRDRLDATLCTVCTYVCVCVCMKPCTAAPKRTKQPICNGLCNMHARVKACCGGVLHAGRRTLHCSKAGLPIESAGPQGSTDVVDSRQSWQAAGAGPASTAVSEVSPQKAPALCAALRQGTRAAPVPLAAAAAAMVMSLSRTAVDQAAATAAPALVAHRRPTLRRLCCWQRAGSRARPPVELPE